MICSPGEWHRSILTDRLAPVHKTSFHILVASLTLRAIRVRLATSIWYDTLMKNCFKGWSQSTFNTAMHSMICSPGEWLGTSSG